MHSIVALRIWASQYGQEGPHTQGCCEKGHCNQGSLCPAGLPQNTSSQQGMRTAMQQPSGHMTMRQLLEEMRPSLPLGGTVREQVLLLLYATWHAAGVGPRLSCKCLSTPLCNPQPTTVSCCCPTSANHLYITWNCMPAAKLMSDLRFALIRHCDHAWVCCSAGHIGIFEHAMQCLGFMDS